MASLPTDEFVVLNCMNICFFLTPHLLSLSSVTLQVVLLSLYIALQMLNFQGQALS